MSRLNYATLVTTSDFHDHVEPFHRIDARLSTLSLTFKPVIVEKWRSLPQPGQRVHADLFGTLKAPGNHKNHKLCMTDAITKYDELATIENKEAPTVAEAIFFKVDLPIRLSREGDHLSGKRVLCSPHRGPVQADAGQLYQQRLKNYYSKI